MKSFFFVLLLAFGFSSLAEEPNIIGEWKFTQYILDGDVRPLPNPDLDLRFNFSQSQVATLFWSRKNEEGFCERKASYSVQDHLLYQKIFWVNPENRSECSRDPDMQMGAETVNEVRREELKIQIDFQLSDKIMTYVFELVR